MRDTPILHYNVETLESMLVAKYECPKCGSKIEIELGEVCLSPIPGFAGSDKDPHAGLSWRCTNPTCWRRALWQVTTLPKIRGNQAMPDLVTLVKTKKYGMRQRIIVKHC